MLAVKSFVINVIEPDKFGQMVKLLQLTILFS